MSSIRLQIFVGLFISVVILTFLQMFWSILSVNHEIDEKYDAEMIRFAQRLAYSDLSKATTRWPTDGLTEELILGLDATYEDKEDASEYTNGIQYAIIAADGQIVLDSSHLPLASLTVFPGFTNITVAQATANDHSWSKKIFNLFSRLHIIPDYGWRVYTLPLDNQGEIRVAQDSSLRREIVLDVIIQPTLIMLLSPFLLMLIAALIIQRGFSPIKKLTAEVEHRHVDNMLPLDEKKAPLEVHHFIVAINQLLARLSLSVDNERRFTANASHELRTPLTALRLHAQNALVATDKSTALNAIITAIDAMSATISQILMLARLEGGQVIQKTPIPLAPLLRRVIASSAVAVQPQPTIELEIDEQIMVPATDSLLEILFHNLLENAFRYTKTAVWVNAQVHKKEVEVRIRDDGPGLPKDDLAKVFEPYYHPAGNHHGICGLGLTICQAATKNLHGSIRLINDNGLTAIVRLPIISSSP